MLKLRNLNESFEKLEEAWNPTFPNWLQDRLTKMRKAYGTEKGGDAEGVWNIPWEERPEFSHRGWVSDRETRGMSILGGMLDNLNMDNIKVIEGPVPSKKTDERLQPPNIGIWGFSNGQVYIEGWNEKEKIRRTNGKETVMGYLPFKEKIALADKFAYIDGDTIEPTEYYSKRSDRARKRRELYDMGYGRQGKKGEEQWSQNAGWSEKIDKSGYLVDPEKYKKKLEDIRANDYARILEERHDDLEEYRQDLVAAMQYYDPFEDQEAYDNLRNVFTYLKDSIRYYNSVADTIDSYIENINQNPSMESHYKDQIKRQVKNLMNDNDFKRLQNYADRYFLGSADWLE